MVREDHRASPRFVVTALMAIVLMALAIRFPKLDERPLHGDEANQMVKAGILLETGRYVYDPHEHHGPTLYYLTLPSFWGHGVTTFAQSEEEDYRIVPVVFGVLLVLLLWPFSQGLGRMASVFAALLTAASPAMVYYSRYYIQEMLLVVFTFLVIVAGWRWFASGRTGWAVLTGIALALVHATKETSVLAYTAMLAGLVFLFLLRGKPLEPGRTYPLVTQWREATSRRRVVMTLPLLSAVVVTWVVFFSSFFTHWRGVPDSILTYASYLHRAGGVGMHDKPWHYYLGLLVHAKFPLGPHWSEGFIVALALVGAAGILAPRTHLEGDRRLLVFLFAYTVVVAVLYALIPYKTPWCVLTMLHALILLAGVGAAWLVQRAKKLPLRMALFLLLAAGTAHLGLQAYRAAYVFAADIRNPYVYAHSVPGIKSVEERMDALSAVATAPLVVKVMAKNGDYWPLPWYLRRVPYVGSWADIPNDPDASVILASPEFQPELDLRLKNQYQVEYYGLRPNVLLVAYIRQDLWDAYIETRR